MNPSQSKLYKYHVENARQVERALTQVTRQLHRAIGASDADSLNAFRPLYFLLIGVLAECKFNQLIHEPVFSDNDRATVTKAESQINKWTCLLRYSFIRHYSPPRGNLAENTMPFSAFARYDELNNLLTNELQLIIELRNKLAHGQWAYPFNNVGTNIEPEKCRILRNENVLILQFKKKLITNIIDIVYDLVVSKKTFERDFDLHYKQLVDIRRDMETRSYEKWALALQEKYRRGVTKRKSHFLAGEQTTNSKLSP